MQLFYSSDINTLSNSFTFDKEESKHIVKVLRKKEGDILHLTNGKGQLFTGEITLASEKSCQIAIVEKESISNTPWNIHLAVAPTKMNERFEWFLEKATEIGIHEITPIICERSERKIIKPERMEKIILSAMKQSNQLFLPKLNPAVSFNDFITSHNNECLYIAHCEEDQKQQLSDVILPNKRYTLLIGPEGDFSPSEIKKALERNYIPVALGNTRLRTETAAVVGCHTFVLKNL